jgi:putative component of membrane protein insertase Oxa1/YidC/SpoIIIJ protein YidD
MPQNIPKTMNKIALELILFYQRFISPYKGFSCAYHAYTGRDSCSAHGYRVVQRYGFLFGVQLIKRRMSLCGKEYRKHIKVGQPRANALILNRRQSGFCDVGCDVGACDLGDVSSCAFDGLGNCGSLPCDCDFGNWGRRKKNEDQYIEIAPHSMPKSRRQLRIEDR